jgi:hypothetical protein
VGFVLFRKQVDGRRTCAPRAEDSLVPAEGVSSCFPDLGKRAHGPVIGLIVNQELCSCSAGFFVFGHCGRALGRRIEIGGLVEECLGGLLHGVVVAGKLGSGGERHDFQHGVEEDECFGVLGYLISSELDFCAVLIKSQAMVALQSLCDIVSTP